MAAVVDRIHRPWPSSGSARHAVVPFLLVTSAIAVISWSVAQRRPVPTAVVIITLDTTRADRLPIYGYMDAAMPHLDRLARDGIVFDRAVTVAPLTLPAHTSLFTGLYPPRHGVRDNGSQSLAPHHTTLAEHLQAEGFRTAAFVGSVVLDPDRGLAQGFERYGVVGARDPGPMMGQRRGDEVMDDALRWLEDVEGRFFLWVHSVRPAPAVPILRRTSGLSPIPTSARSPSPTRRSAGCSMRSSVAG